MKIVVAFVVALTLVACSFAATNDNSTGTSNNVKSWNTTNTTNNVNTTNNANTSNKTNTTNKTKSWNNAGTTNNVNTTNNTESWNNTNTNPTNNTTFTNKSNHWNNANTSAQGTVKVSLEGFAAMRAIHAARVAIFNGQPKVANEWLNRAQSELQTVAKNAPLYITTTEASVNGKVVADDMTVTKTNWIPIDSQLSLSDTFVSSPKNAKHIQKANQYFKNGQGKEAVEELRLASIDVRCTRALMSLTTTTNCVAEAVKLVGQQKYYEANVVLKTAEDGVVMDSTNLFATPKYNTQKTTETN
jgi:hypothetical protein